MKSEFIDSRHDSGNTAWMTTKNGNTETKILVQQVLEDLVETGSRQPAVVGIR